ncbi:MAG: deoxyribose-phosphate aldolase [Verrucomicrobia bacterium]|nr:deoxyribose-phosphate aldolase [Verrucomicrobiota bacterium]
MDITKLSSRDLAAYMDATNLRADATLAELQALCQDAAALQCAAVCLYPTDVSNAAAWLQGSKTRVATVIGFPSGRFSLMAKEAEVAEAARSGAHEVDIVMNYSHLLAGKKASVLEEVKVLTAIAHDHGMLSKIIVETCYLPESLLLTALELCEAAEADFIKTSTGFGSGGAQVEHIRLWAQRRQRIRIKASGGIRTLADALKMIEAGADRLGLSSARQILDEFEGRKTESTKSDY